jgi:hypothetical protein
MRSQLFADISLSVCSVLMKLPSNDDTVRESVPVCLEKSDSDRSPQSLFKLLLQIESQLRAETRNESLLQVERRKSVKFLNTNISAKG